MGAAPKFPRFFGGFSPNYTDAEVFSRLLPEKGQPSCNLSENSRDR